MQRTGRSYHSRRCKLLDTGSIATILALLSTSFIVHQTWCDSWGLHNSTAALRLPSCHVFDVLRPQ